MLTWPAAVGDRGLRRLQLAAEAGECWGVLFRTARMQQRSPAAVRLKLEPFSRGALVQILKCRGRGPAAPLIIDLEAAFSLFAADGHERLSPTG